MSSSNIRSLVQTFQNTRLNGDASAAVVAYYHASTSKNRWADSYKFCNRLVGRGSGRAYHASLMAMGGISPATQAADCSLNDMLDALD